METNKHGKSGGSAFFWGLIIGGLLATLLTTKRGRTILREVVNLGIELLEDFVEDRSSKNPAEGEARQRRQEEEIIEATEDLKSEVTEVDTEPVQRVEPAPPPAKNGHSKRRLFRGIRRK